MDKTKHFCEKYVQKDFLKERFYLHMWNKGYNGTADRVRHNHIYQNILKRYAQYKTVDV